MRRLLFAFIVVFPLCAHAGEILATRSAQHELRIERSVESVDRVSYAIRVSDVRSGKVLLERKLDGTLGEALDAVAATSDSYVHVHLAYTEGFFSATVDVTSGGTVVDNFRTWWQVEQRLRSSMPETVVRGVVGGTVGGSGQATPSASIGAGAFRVGGDVKAPVVIRRVEPVYSVEARRARISGIVILEVVIDTDGHVKEAQVLKPLPYGLDQAAVDAVRQWEFKPGTLNGKAVPVIFNLTMNFKLDTAPPPPAP